MCGTMDRYKISIHYDITIRIQRKGKREKRDRRNWGGDGSKTIKVKLNICIQMAECVRVRFYC